MRNINFLLIILLYNISISATIIDIPLDQSSIQAGINASSTGDTILVQPGTYYENIDYNGHNVTVASLYLTTQDTSYILQTIIDGNQNDSVVKFTGDVSGLAKLIGFTIINGYSLVGGGIRVWENCDPFISNVIIRENTSSMGGGIGCFYAEPVIESSVITDNTSEDIGGGIGATDYCTITLNDVEISNNVASGKGGGIYLTHWCDATIVNATITKNYSADEGSIGVYYSDIGLKNSIVWDNSPESFYIGNSSSINCQYSNVFGGYGGSMNLDPLFVDSTNDNFHLTENSPCIDMGDPNPIYDDTDGTRCDMQAVYHDYHETTALESRVNYRSFPVLDRTLGSGLNTMVTCLSVKDQTDYFEITDIDRNYVRWIEDYWETNDLQTLDSTLGYKMETNYTLEIPTSGITLPEDTEVSLSEGVNWVGYFVEKSLTIQDAFSDIWEHVTAVGSEDWWWDNSGVYPSNRCTLIYGKMYIVYVNENCSFTYTDGVPQDPKERGMTEGFSFSETPEYTPINIVSIDDPDVEEIGIFVGDVCKGAAKVEEFPVQILAFLDEPARAEVTFEFYYGDRSYQIAKGYNLLDEQTNNYVTADLELLPYQSETIMFGEPENVPTMFFLADNYPNPFNPTTTINYSIPNDTDVSLSIYNVKGQKVTTLVNGNQIAGSYNAVWNGTDDKNNKVSSGIYFYKITAGEKTEMKKMVLMK
jgi:hypothetical protein